jgi:tripartite-type tricarboxylate transporter receptor subunit TctC
MSSTSSVGSGQHLAASSSSRAGIDLAHSTYKGGPPAVAAVASGESAVGFMTVTAGLDRPVPAACERSARAGQRLPQLLVPTIAESRYPGFEVTPGFGLYVPEAAL